jgi:hypothetical protein
MRRIVVIAVVLAAGAAVHAEPADVPGLIKIIQAQPKGMDRTEWKEQRRDAARKLAETKDKRAVPVLVQLADTETFDIIGEIAIDGLGELGDPVAIPELQKIAADSTRDAGQREKAKKALARLGAAPSGGNGGGGATAGAEAGAGGASGGGTGTEGAGGSTGASAGAGSASATAPATSTADLLGGSAAPDLPPLPAVPDDALAASERVTFATGTANFGYDTVRKRLDFDADVAGSYAKRIERPTFAWGVDADAHVVAGLINPQGDAQSRGTQIVAHGDGEARFYRGSIYGVGKAAADLQLDYVSDDDGNGNTFKSTQVWSDLEVAVGAGYGRVLDVGAAIRVRRLARALDAAKALGKPIDAATAKKLQLAWWALRGERTTYRSLLATVAILREAGVLLGEPDAGLTYDILDVLRDTQLYARPSGIDAQLSFSEGFLQRPDMPMIENGHIEQLLAQVGYGKQLDDDLLEVSGTAFARAVVFGAAGTPAPRAVGATATVRRFTYAAHGDPIGALDLTGTVGLSTDDQMQSDTSLLVGAELGFTYWLNQASGLRLAADVTENNGVLTIGANLQATYALLDGTFAR